MVIRRKGYLIAMYLGKTPWEPETTSMLFGPVATADVSFSSENLSSNGLKVFDTKRMARKAAEERLKVFGRRGFKVTLMKAELRIAETREDWEELREFGSYIAIVSADPHNRQWVNLHGTAMVNGKRISTAHDSWADLYMNGLTPFTDFGHMVGETSLGVVPELSRQAMCRAQLVGIGLKEEPPRKRK